METPDQALSAALEEHRAALLRVAAQRLHPMLSRRLSPEDIVQETFAAACRKGDYLRAHPEVPMGFKLRTLLLQTLADAERRHLQCRGRDAFREAEPPPVPAGASLPGDPWEALAASVTSPASKAARADRRAALLRAFEALPEVDRRILALRHFDGRGNAECAALLGISPTAAGQRHVRALQRLRQALTALTEFRP